MPALGEHRERLGKIDVLDLHREAENVAADVADPALEGLALRIYLQAGAGVVVPGTECFVDAPFATQLQVLAGEIDDVDRLANLILGVEGGE